MQMNHLSRRGSQRPASGDCHRSVTVGLGSQLGQDARAEAHADARYLRAPEPLERGTGFVRGIVST